MANYQSSSGGTTSFPLRFAAATFFADDVATIDNIESGGEIETTSKSKQASPSGKVISVKTLSKNVRPRVRRKSTLPR